MIKRFCPQCRSEVEDAGGYCLLGHSLRLSAPVDDLKALRAEVDRAFEEARVQVSDALNQPPVVPVAVDPAGGSEHVPPPPPSSRRDPFVELARPEAAGGPDPMDEFAPAPRMDWGPERVGLLKRLS